MKWKKYACNSAEAVDVKDWNHTHTHKCTHNHVSSHVARVAQATIVKCDFCLFSMYMPKWKWPDQICSPSVSPRPYARN